MIDCRHCARTLSVVALFSMLVACGGGSSGTATSNTGATGSGSSGSGGAPVTPTNPVVIQGVATPSSVAVVTATNAN